MLGHNWSYTGRDLTLTRPAQASLHLNCLITPTDSSAARFLIEFRPMEQQLKLAREQRQMVRTLLSIEDARSSKRVWRPDFLSLVRRRKPRR